MMAGRSASVRVVSVALLLASACGNDQLDPDGGSSGGAGPASGGSAQGGGGKGSGGAGGESASGGSDQGSGGDSSATPEPCKMVDGKLAYGPIGEPHPWPLDTVSTSSGDCSWCGVVEGYSAFRTTAGYGFVWRMGVSGNAPAPNLFGMTVDANFEGGEPRALIESPVTDFEITEAKSGFVVSTCSADSEPRWTWLTSELEAADSPSFVFEGARCISYDAPSVLWTGQRYLTTFTDARGLVLASLDEAGTLIGEEILAEVDEPAPPRLSKNRDRVLVVYNPGTEKQLQYKLLDLEGAPLQEAKPFGIEVDSSRTRFLITTSGDGWLVLNDTGGVAELPATLTKISRDGLATPGSALGELSLRSFTPSSHGGSLLLTHWYEDDLHGHSFSRMMVIDDAGEVVYTAEEDYAFDGPFPQDVVDDPFRDLIVQGRRVDGSSDHLEIQEYGCLD